MMDNTLGGRLLSVAGFVRQGAVFADIGTDHAHLPIFLLKNGKISRAVCSDINKGPLSLAVANVTEAGFSDCVDFVLTDGAASLTPYCATDYAICGMGGELIADIISRAEQLKNPDINLILQPMTKQSTLRKFLASEGFTVTDEAYSTDEGKHYVCMLCSYTGAVCEMSEIDAELGLKNAKNANKTSHILYLKGKIKATETKIKGLNDGGLGTKEQELLLSALLERVRELEGEVSHDS